MPGRRGWRNWATDCFDLAPPPVDLRPGPPTRAHAVDALRCRATLFNSRTPVSWRRRWVFVSWLPAYYTAWGALHPSGRSAAGDPLLISLAGCTPACARLAAGDQPPRRGAGADTCARGPVRCDLGCAAPDRLWPYRGTGEQLRRWIIAGRWRCWARRGWRRCTTRALRLRSSPALPPPPRSPGRPRSTRAVAGVDARHAELVAAHGHRQLAAGLRKASVANLRLAAGAWLLLVARHSPLAAARRRTCSPPGVRWRCCSLVCYCRRRSQHRRFGLPRLPFLPA